MSTGKDIIMEQRADIRSILLAVPGIKDMARGAGVHVTMIGPIQITHANGTEHREQAYIEIEQTDELPEGQKAVRALPEQTDAQGPLLLRGLNTEPELDEQTVKRFAPIYAKLPEPKLDSAVRLVVETAYRRDKSPKSVAKALNCSIYKARSIMNKYGLST